MRRLTMCLALVLIANAVASAQPASAPTTNLTQAQQLAQQGLAELSQGNFANAAQSLQNAIQLNPHSVDLWLALGDANYQLSANDLDRVRAARVAWEQALEIDPANRPALRRLLKFWSDAADVDDSHPDVFDSLAKTAARLFVAEPDNASAEAAVYISVLRPWLVGSTIDITKVEESIDRLKAVAARLPGDPDVMLYLALSLMKKANLARATGGQPVQVQQLITEAEAAVDRGLRYAPESAAMRLKAARIIDVELISSPTQQLIDHRRELLVSATKLVHPDDELFVPVHIAAARASGDRLAAERILRNALAARPEDPSLHLALADCIAADKSRCREAIAVLESPASLDLLGPKAFVKRELDAQTNSTLTDLRLDLFPAASDAERQAMISKIAEGVSKQLAEAPGEAKPLRLLGKFQRLKGELTAAIESLSKAKQAYEQMPESDVPVEALEKWETIDLLARCYLDTGHPGQAQPLLASLLTRFPQYDPARVLLTDALIRQGNSKEAEAHIVYLEQKHPGDAEVIRLRQQIQGALVQTTQPIAR